MGYTEAPVYNDPPSNQWFGMQAWGVQRVAELYYASGNAQAKKILDKWVPWVVANISTDGANWKVPSELTWTGKPDTWNKTNPGSNSGLSVAVKSYGQDVGVAGDTARALLFYAAKSGDTASRDKAKALLDAIWASNQDDLGVGTVETRGDFLRFDDTYVAGGNGIYIPSGWTGTMPNGDVIKPGVSFLDIRSWYKNDPALAEDRDGPGHRCGAARSRSTGSGRRPPSRVRSRTTRGCSRAPRPRRSTPRRRRSRRVCSPAPRRRRRPRSRGRPRRTTPVARVWPGTTSTAARRWSAPRPPRRSRRPA